MYKSKNLKSQYKMSENLSYNNQKMELIVNESSISIETSDGRVRPRVCYLGPEGSYTYTAKGKLLGESGFEEKAIRGTNGQMVRLVDNREFDLAVVAAENSTEGDVTETQRELIRTQNTRILAESIERIYHSLIGKPRQPIENILSHPQALGQCSIYLSRHYPKANLIPTSSTSDAVERIESMKNAAAIAGKLLAEKHKLQVLKENINDNPRNATRFFLLGRGEAQPTGNDTTTLLFVPNRDYVGVLRDCLNIFASLGINLTHLSSHPTGEIGIYAFRASIDGHEKDTTVQQALTVLQGEYCRTIKILGSYKKAKAPESGQEPGTNEIEF